MLHFSSIFFLILQVLKSSVYSQGVSGYTCGALPWQCPFSSQCLDPNTCVFHGVAYTPKLLYYPDLNTCIFQCELYVPSNGLFHALIVASNPSGQFVVPPNPPIGHVYDMVQWVYASEVKFQVNSLNYNDLIWIKELPNNVFRAWRGGGSNKLPSSFTISPRRHVQISFTAQWPCSSDVPCRRRLRGLYEIPSNETSRDDIIKIIKSQSPRNNSHVHLTFFQGSSGMGAKFP